MRHFSKQTLSHELARARANGWDRVCANVEREESLPRCLLLAIASHETDMNDVVGDNGHGRGLFQIDDRSHEGFLASQRADRPGRKPAVRAAARYAATLLKQNWAYGRHKGVPDRDLLKFGISAYNAGPGGAYEGYRTTGDSDRRTTPGDYARDVMARMALFRELVNGGVQKPLKRGMRSRRVEELKDRLAAWYARHAPGEYDRFGVKPGPFFGAGVEQLVRDFQRRTGLEMDGIVGPKTLGALEQGRPPRRRRARR